MRKILGKKIFFKSKIATDFFQEILDSWPELIKNKKNIVFLPCASTKPIQNSKTHCYLSPITRNFPNNTLLVIVSEPLTIIPYEKKEYPNYDYEPKDLMNNEDELRFFIERLSKFRKITPKKINCYYIGGQHHYKILKMAGWNVRYFEPKKGLIDYKEQAVKLNKKISTINDMTKIKIKTEYIDRNRILLNFIYAT